VACRAVAQRLNADHSDQAARVVCRCGGEARFVGRREKTFTTVLGERMLERAYFHCRAASLPA
jgi:hypothetical protein